MPKVSVIIPTYNRAKYVTEAIDSVLAQTYKDYEIIVVDDGSTDDTKSRLLPYMDQIKYIYQKNSGVSAARNNGIRTAKGEWIAFLDSDDEWLANKLAVQLDFILRNPSVIAHSINIDLSDYESVSKTSFQHCSFLPKDKEGYIYKPLIHHCKYTTTMMPPGVICKKKAAVKAGLFDISLSISEDYDFMCRLALQGNWGYSDNILAVAHRRNELFPTLSSKRYIDPTNTSLSLIKTHSKLLSDHLLDDCEKEFVSKLLSRNYRTLGQLLSKKSAYKESRDAFRKAYDTHISPKSFIWYIFSLLPGCVIKKVVNLRLT